MRHFGYFMTESTGHLSEYVPWFRSSERALKTYCDEPAFGGESGAYYKYCAFMAKKYGHVDYLGTESQRLGKRSVEYCSYILEAMETDKPFRLNGNVRNDGYITNLPAGCCVEVPVFVDKQGLHPLRVGALPPQCAALNQTNVTVQSLAVEAGLTGDPEHIVHAVALDPLTSTRCTLKEVREMAAEMLKAEAPVAAAVRGQAAEGDADDLDPGNSRASRCRSTRPWPSPTASANWRRERSEQEENMAEQKKVRIGFVGVGSMGQCAHLKNYAVIPECEVVALAELRPDTGETGCRALRRAAGLQRTTRRCWPRSNSTASWPRSSSPGTARSCPNSSKRACRSSPRSRSPAPSRWERRSSKP